jgi:V/A-type H+-transporting ATPase subunit I
VFLIASRSIAQIKDISELPGDFKRVQSEFFKIEDEDKQDLNVHDYKVQILKNRVTEIGENLDFLAKKLKIKPDPNLRSSYEFHIKDLDDLVEKLFNTTKDFYVRVQQLFNARITAENTIEKLQERILVVQNLARYDLKKAYIENLRMIQLKLAIVSRKNVELLEGELSNSNIFFQEQLLNDASSLFIVAAPPGSVPEMSRELDLYNAKAFEFTDTDFSPDGILDPEQSQAELKKLVKERANMDDEFKRTKQELEVEIIAMQEVYQNAIKFLQNHEKMKFFKDSVIAEFWVRVKDWPQLEAELKSNFVDRIRYVFREVSRAETYKEEGQEGGATTKKDEPPIYIKIPKILQPYTTILKLYGLPQYSELNPLVIIFISFPLLFGLMFGDVGQGLALMLTGLVIAKLFRARQGYHNLGIVIFWCGIGAVFGGFVYGEVFGYPAIDISIGGVRIFPWYHPFPEPGEIAMFGVGTAMQLLKFTIWIGTFQMSTGLVLRMYNHALIKRFYLIFVDPVPKLFILWDIWLAIQTYGLNIPMFMSAAFLSSLQGILLIGAILVLVFGQLIGKAARVPYLKKKSTAELLGGQSMDLFETFLSFLSNALSYTRIFAMTMVHLGFIFAIRLIADQISHSLGDAEWVYIIAFAIGSALVVALELILVLIQNVRLHFYEFFSKFYKGGGTEFKMLKYDVRFSKLYFDDSERFIIEMPASR